MVATKEANKTYKAVLEDLANHRSPSKKLSKKEAFEAISGIKLVNGGSHADPQTGISAFTAEYRAYTRLCIMQVVNVYDALINGKKADGGSSPSYTDVDQVDPIIEHFMVAFNDGIKTNAERRRLLDVVPRLLNTKVSEKTELRIKMAKKEAIKVVLNSDDPKIKKWLKDTYLYGYTTGEDSQKNFLDRHDAWEVLGIYYGRYDIDAGLKFLDRMLKARVRKPKAKAVKA